MNMHDHEKSDSAIVSKNVPNNERSLSAEGLEKRAEPKRNRDHEAMVRTQRRAAMSNGLVAVRQAARKDKRIRFTALLHHLTIDLLRESYFALKKNSAAGIDGVTWKAYGSDLEKRLHFLHNQIHKGSYRANAAKRVYIPKADGSRRPLSIWCLEDKIVQQATVTVLSAVYEADFLGFSYGFRPGKGQHDALDALTVGIYRHKVNWILDADIQKFFDRMSHEWLEKFLKHRIGDKRLLRLIKKWTKVGILEEGNIIRASMGVPQGAVISPILANIYLHYAYDLWANQWRKRKTNGEVIIIRYADDTIVGFQYETDAKAFYHDLKNRLEKFGLKLHPEKTRTIRFGKYAQSQCKQMGIRKPETFDFLGFTHYCGRSWKTGNFVLGRKTIKKKMRSKLQEIKAELRKRLHRSIGETGRWLARILKGHLNYFSVPGNGKSINSFFYRVSWYWLRSLRRRSQRSAMTWERYAKLKKLFFPKIQIIHPRPWARFDAKTRGRSPVR